jgi:hypothetical protein
VVPVSHCSRSRPAGLYHWSVMISQQEGHLPVVEWHLSATPRAGPAGLHYWHETIGRFVILAGRAPTCSHLAPVCQPLTRPPCLLGSVC